jgi:hypothetical protein
VSLDAALVGVTDEVIAEIYFPGKRFFKKLFTFSPAGSTGGHLNCERRELAFGRANGNLSRFDHANTR